MQAAQSLWSFVRGKLSYEEVSSPVPNAPELKKPSWVLDLESASHLRNAKWTREQLDALGFKGAQYVGTDTRITYGMFWNTEKKITEGYSHFSVEVEGPPGCVHGGCIAAILDELSGSTVFSTLEENERAVTVNLNVNYRKFIPLNSWTKLSASVTKREGRKIFVSAAISSENGTLHAESTAIFLVVQPRNPNNNN